MNRSAASLLLCLALATIGSLLVPRPAAAQGLFDLFNLGPNPRDEAKYRTEYVEGDRDATDEVLLIRINGTITMGDDDDPTPFEFKRSLMDRLDKDLEAALKLDRVKAVLLEVNSPGGEVTASDIIHHKLSKLKARKKPIVTLIGQLGASGGYYVACAGDKIFAHPTSVLGSIGVIMQTANIEKLADMIGFRHIALKSERTPKKDVLSPFREMTEEEHRMLMSIIDGMHDRFIAIVAAARGKSPQEITKLADGSLYTAEQALANGLIDGIGYREDALAKAAELAGLKTAKLVRRKAKKGLAELLGDLVEMHSGAPAFLAWLEAQMAAHQVPAIKYQFSIGK
ncbi:MAG: signal peptide peptidase SppA, 36K type [Candidatus Ozemobacter sibiricus]|uniref:Signal peptide peptidase SppA, 36K type n=1 Tax=Candidatus Ozemobacter sibiricus TaxID=2268124 RepID=A0A367ZMF3_9BACT|nr:MAG: signal peptide peptidase SppA, 36K type [Candidatus Ozemobacter sibiricus]